MTRSEIYRARRRQKKAKHAAETRWQREKAKREHEEPQYPGPSPAETAEICSDEDRELSELMDHGGGRKPVEPLPPHWKMDEEDR